MMSPHSVCTSSRSSRLLQRTALRVMCMSKPVISPEAPNFENGGHVPSTQILRSAATVVDAKPSSVSPAARVVFVGISLSGADFVPKEAGVLANRGAALRMGGKGMVTCPVAGVAVDSGFVKWMQSADRGQSRMQRPAHSAAKYLCL
jgi:hypothetical protein